MEIYTNTKRHYREKFLSSDDEYGFNIIVKETDLFILLPKAYPEERAREKTWEIILKCRNELEAYMALYPEFYSALFQEKVDRKALPIIQEMQQAGKCLGVGAFAAVAGTIAEKVARYLYVDMENMGLKKKDVLVENGGDVFILSKKKRVIALMNNPSHEIELGILVPENKGLSLCASSAFIGHSKSFGKAQLVTVKAVTGAIADAGATAYGNILKTKADFKILEKRLKNDSPYGISGVFAQCEESFFVWGDIELAGLK